MFRLIDKGEVTGPLNMKEMDVSSTSPDLCLQIYVGMLRGLIPISVHQ